MKTLKSFLLLPFLFLVSETNALLLNSESENTTQCVGWIQSAVSPNGECKKFTNTCDIPNDWKVIPSCNLIENNTDKKKISLQEKMKQRFGQRNLSFRTNRNTKKTTSKKNKYSRYARKKTSGLRKTRAYVNPSNIKNNKKLKTFTKKRRKFYSRQKLVNNHKFKTQKSIKKYIRPKIRSNISKNLDKKLSTTLKWKVAKKNHFRAKSYGKNPYSLHSKYSQKQKEERDRINKKINVKKRLHSGFKTFRGERKLGSLDGEVPK